MKNRLILSFILSLLFMVSGFVLSQSYTFGLCFSDIKSNSYDVSCHIKYSDIGDPLFYGMGAIAIVFLMLVFKPEGISSWKKFAKWYIPLAALVFIFYGSPSSGDFFSPYPERVYQWLAGAYVLVSGFLIVRSR